MRSVVRLLPLACVAVLPACAAVTTAAPPVPLRAALAVSVDSIIRTPPVQRATWGVLITDARTREVLYSRNAEQLLIPASNMKLLPTAVALGLLGPGWRYRTEVLTTPVMSGATSSIIVRASGDPTWSTRYWPTVAAPFDSLAAAVERAGVRRATRLVIDVSRFADEPVHPTWEVSDLPGVFAPPVDAFAAAEGTFRLALFGGPVAGAPGDAAVVAPLAQPVAATVTTDTAGARPAVSIDFLSRRDTVRLAARVRAGGSDTTTHAVTRPAESAAAALRSALAARGIAVDTVLLLRDTAAARAASVGAVPVGALLSPPLADIVAGILRPSQNWMTEQLLKTLGAEFAADGSWRGGNAVEREFLVRTIGLDSTSFQLRDGSGMSPQNLLSPVAAVGILGWAAQQPWAAAYRDAMAQPGLAGSTLSGRLRPLQGRLHAKTGSITNVNTLSGYFTAADGREVLFAILTNGSGAPAAAMRAAIDEVVMAMARHLDGSASTR